MPCSALDRKATKTPPSEFTPDEAATYIKRLEKLEKSYPRVLLRDNTQGQSSTNLQKGHMVLMLNTDINLYICALAEEV